MKSNEPASVTELANLDIWPTAVREIRPLTGLSGGSLLVTLDNGQRYVARGQDPLLQMQGVSREHEAQVLNAIREQVTRLEAEPLGTNFLPRVIGQHPRWLIVSWLKGTPWSSDLATDEAAQQHLIALMRRFHPLDCPVSLEIPVRLHHYRQLLDLACHPRALFSLYECFTRQRPPRRWFPVLAHHDIHPGNLLCHGATLALIDWEYAARSPLACELILLFEANGFNAEQRTRFCEYYAHALYLYNASPDNTSPVLQEAPVMTAPDGDAHRVNTQVNKSHANMQWLSQLHQDIRRWQPWCEMLMGMWSAIRFQQTGAAHYALWRDNYLAAAEQSLLVANQE
ncbi:MAG: phosphotransferase [Plesiomonas sp.]